MSQFLVNYKFLKGNVQVYITFIGLEPRLEPVIGEVLSSVMVNLHCLLD